MMTIHRRISRVIPFFLSVVLLAGCGGYHFPGDPETRTAAWKNTILTIGGDGARQHPVLAQKLKGLLADRLGIPTRTTPPPKDAPSTLGIEFSVPERNLTMESSSGRADQYEIILRATPTLQGTDHQAPRHYPTAMGRASYYELRTSATTQMAQVNAQSEALDNLAYNLIAILVNTPD